MDKWQGLRPWLVMRFNTQSLRWETIGRYAQRGDAETAAATMNRYCRIVGKKIFKAVFEG